MRGFVAPIGLRMPTWFIITQVASRPTRSAWIAISKPWTLPDKSGQAEQSHLCTCAVDLPIHCKRVMGFIQFPFSHFTTSCITSNLGYYT